MKKCIIMFALLVAALLIAAWSNKVRYIDADHAIASKVDPLPNHMLMNDSAVNKRYGE